MSQSRTEEVTPPADGVQTIVSAHLLIAKSHVKKSGEQARHYPMEQSSSANNRPNKPSVLRLARSIKQRYKRAITAFKTTSTKEADSDAEQ